MPKTPLEALAPNTARAVLKITEAIHKAGGQALLVGGCVRDALWEHTTEDADIEVYGLPADVLEKLVGQYYAYDGVGKAFGVLKLKGIAIDIALPRKESKIAEGHQGFAIMGDPFMSFEEASSRRDFTINAIGYDPLNDEWLDPQGGLKDVENKQLRHVGPAFSEDPLRVLRGMQFIARFGLKATPETLALCRTLTPKHLSRERIFEEWKKLILKGAYPALGLNFLKETDWLQYFPELEALIGCQQDPVWHPEGDVWVHTGHCLNAFAEEKLGDEREDLVVGLAVLCHDMGKPLTTQAMVEGRIRSPGHDVAGEAPTRSFLARITEHKALIEAVIPLVLTHMRPTELFKANATDAAIRRLAVKVERIDRLVRVVRADKGGRPPLPRGECPEGTWLLQRATKLKVSTEKPKPLLLGRHLIELRLSPSPAFKQILEATYDAQLEGTVQTLDEAFSFAKSILSK